MAPDRKAFVRSITGGLIALGFFSLMNVLLKQLNSLFESYLVLYHLMMFTLGLYIILNHKQFTTMDRWTHLCVFGIVIIEISLLSPEQWKGHPVFIINSLAYFFFFSAVTFIPWFHRRFRIQVNENMTRDIYSPLLEGIISVDRETSVLQGEISLIEGNKEDVAFIFDTMNDVDSKLDIQEIFAVIRDVFMSRMGVDNLAVILKNAEPDPRKENNHHFLYQNIDVNMMKYIDYIEDKATRFFYLSNLPSYTLRISDDWAALENADKIPYESFVLIPLYTHKTNRGFVGFFLKNASSLHQERLNFAIFAVHNLSLALNKMVLFQKLKTLSTLDGLTKLFLHRIFMEKLESEFVRAKRYGKNLSIVMMDIDHFKKFNDNYGHLVATACVKRVGKPYPRIHRQGHAPGQIWR